MSFSKENRIHTLNGILFVGLFAIASLYLAEIVWLAKLGISSLVIAIVLGIIYSHTLRHQLPDVWVPGIHFSAKRLLRLAIILYGFRITFQQIVALGIQSLLVDLMIVASTLLLGYGIAVKIFKLDRHLALLVCSGSAICGAAAVLAVEGVLKSESYKATIAVATVVLFGTIAMFLYPLMQNIGLLGFSEHQFGVFAGASIHEVAQALVAGASVSAQAGDTAVVVKMTRVLLLVPVLILLSLYESRAAIQQNGKKAPFKLPWFAIAFAAVIGFNSLHLLPATLVMLINHLDIFLLTMAMAAIGMETNFLKMGKVGLKPFYLAFLLFGWLTMSAYLLVNFFFSTPFYSP